MALCRSWRLVELLVEDIRLEERVEGLRRRVSPAEATRPIEAPRSSVALRSAWKARGSKLSPVTRMNHHRVVWLTSGDDPAQRRVANAAVIRSPRA